MLENSTLIVNNASQARMAAAEDLATAMICADLIQDLIPLERAIEIAGDHRKARTEEWQREIHGALIAIEVLNRRGNLQGLD